MFSIILPTKNPEFQLFKNTLKSIKNQTYDNFECLVIDDGSKDPELVSGLVKSLNDDRFKVVRLDKNVGVAAARNKGLDEATKPYVTFCDCDDTLHKDKLKKQSEVLDNYDISIVGTAINYENKFVKKYRIKETYFYLDPLVSLLRVNIAFCGSNVAFKRDFLTKYKIRFKAIFSPADDWEIILDALSKGGKVHYNSSPLVTYNRHINSITASRQYSLKEACYRVHWEYFDLLDHNQVKKYYSKELKNYRNLIFEKFYDVTNINIQLSCDYESYQPAETEPLTLENTMINLRPLVDLVNKNDEEVEEEGEYPSLNVLSIVFLSMLIPTSIVYLIWLR